VIQRRSSIRASCEGAAIEYAWPDSPFLLIAQSRPSAEQWTDSIADAKLPCFAIPETIFRPTALKHASLCSGGRSR
jgi:hypothetical protein